MCYGAPSHPAGVQALSNAHASDAAAPPFKLTIIPVTPFQQNCAILVCAATNRAAIIDPGGDPDLIEQVLADTGATLEKIILTHGHIDHAGAAALLQKKLGVPVEGPHRDEAPLLATLAEVAARYGLPPAQAVTPDRWLEEGDELTIGDLRFGALHCPGHSPGSIVLAWKKPAGLSSPGFAIMGDVLFQGSVGRTDLPGGSHETLVRMIREKIMPLGDDVVFHCGHGPMSTIGRERQFNPFID